MGWRRGTYRPEPARAASQKGVIRELPTVDGACWLRCSEGLQFRSGNAYVTVSLRDVFYIA